MDCSSVVSPLIGIVFLCGKLCVIGLCGLAVLVLVGVLALNNRGLFRVEIVCSRFRRLCVGL